MIADWAIRQTAREHLNEAAAAATKTIILGVMRRAKKKASREFERPFEVNDLIAS